ncbi:MULTISPECIES: YceI family protein [Pseudofrankia]|uniref:YceI family protein n=1 Tax=Pseudofrankia TaxID=2994363 RepID=UPI000234C7AB|nr:MULTISPECIES: YceI family protein [Pseudofrankia]OHV28693.1 hypothetical protein BCD49_37700 [Pseudofrankia sp. EUN1h]
MSDTAEAISDLTGEYVIDPARTRIGFVAHAMVTKVRGSFTEFAGTVRLDEEIPANSSAQIVIKAHSIDTGNADDRHPRPPDSPTRADHSALLGATHHRP